MEQRGQVSTEILIMIGMMLLLLLPLLFYAYGRANATGEDISVQKAEFAAQRLASSADSVGYLGGAAALVEEIELPSNVQNVSVAGKDVVFDIASSAGKKQIVKSSAFSIKAAGFGKMTKAGTYLVEIGAISNYSAGSAEQVYMTVR